jgi:release factor glutamine methyltransferase
MRTFKINFDINNISKRKYVIKMKSEIYEPAEDSYLLNEVLKEYLKDKDKKIKILDMGTGSGIQIMTCIDLCFKNTLAADINKEVIKELKKQKINVIHSNLFSKLYKRKGDLLGKPLVPIRFDLIVFNPPYLPEDNDEPNDSKLATTAGKKGYEIILEFLKQAKAHLSKNGAILLLFSSLSKPTIIKSKANEMGYKIKLLKRKKLFFEELFVYEFLF